MTNEEIRNNVFKILNAIPKDAKIKPIDEVAIMAGVELFINLLQNINDIADKEL